MGNTLKNNLSPLDTPLPPLQLLSLYCILAADKEGPYSKASHSTWPSLSLFNSFTAFKPSLGLTDSQLNASSPSRGKAGPPQRAGMPPNTPCPPHAATCTSKHARPKKPPRPFQKSLRLQSWCAFINCPLNWYQRVTIRVWKQKEALMKHRAAIHLQITMFSCLDSHHAWAY